MKAHLFRWMLLLCLPSLLAPVVARAETPPATRPTTAPAAGFAGEWQTTFGLMRLSRNGDAIDGTYQMGGATCTIHGRVSGSELKFKYAEPAAAGEGVFELAADGSSFTGKWRQQGDQDWQLWSG